MIVPSIDLLGGQTVQLVGGEDPAIEAGDPTTLARRFGRVGPIAVIDLDAARGEGDNARLIESVLPLARCRVGGGIRSVEQAIRWLDAGAEQVILGTMAKPDLLRELPKDRVVAALDARDGEVVVEGWRKGTGARIEERIEALREHVGGFLITFVEREGRLGGTDLERARAMVECAGSVPVTIAGGVTTAAEVAALDALGADAQVGMALYTGRLGLTEAFAAPLSTDREDGLWPTVVVDEHDHALGLVYSSEESLRTAIDEGRGVYWSRSRRILWRKGESSGATQELLEVAADCDRDALRFRVRQAAPGFCHRATHSCWGRDSGLPELARRIADRVHAAPAGSYTRRLLDEPDLLAAKLREEAGELAAAGSAADVAHETADVLYFALVAMARGDVDLAEVERTLSARATRVTRRPGNAKPKG